MLEIKVANPVVCPSCKSPWRRSDALPNCPRCGASPLDESTIPPASAERIRELAARAKRPSERMRALRDAEEADRAAEQSRRAEALARELQNRELAAKAAALENTLTNTTAPAAVPPMPLAIAPPEKIVIELSDTMECPRCAETIKRRAKICRFCNHDLEAEDETPLARRELARRGRDRVPSRGRVEVVHHYHHGGGSSPGLAAFLSFLWIGAGQIYCGRIGRGIAFMFGSGLAAGVLFGATGQPVMLLVWVLIWLINIFDAAACASDSSDGRMGAPRYRGRR